MPKPPPPPGPGTVSGSQNAALSCTFSQNAPDFINVSYFRTFSRLLRVVAGVVGEACCINTDSACHPATLMIYEELLDPRGWSVQGPQPWRPSCQPVRSTRSKKQTRGFLLSQLSRKAKNTQQEITFSEEAVKGSI